MNASQLPPTNTEPPSGTGLGPRVSGAEVRDLGRLRRSYLDRRVGGVASGLARHFDIDPVIVRVLLVVLAFFGGAGLLLYGALCLLVPSDGQTHGTVALEERSRSVAIAIVTAAAAVMFLGDVTGRWSSPWQWVLVAIGAVVLLRRRHDRPVAPGYPGGQWYPSHPAPVPVTPVDPAAPPAPHVGDPVAAGPSVGTGTVETDDTAADPAAPAPSAAPAVDLTHLQALGIAPPPPAPVYAPAGYPQPYSQPFSQPHPQGYPVPYQASYPPPPPRAPHPYRRGPKLWWPTLALIAIGWGMLGMIESAGVDFPAGTYPALGLAITAVMLVLGSIWGRAGGLIFLGLVLALCIAAATSSVSPSTYNFNSEPVWYRPTTAADVQDEYEIGAGELIVDLSHLSDPAQLDGRTVRLRGSAGSITVIAPETITVDTSAALSIGAIHVFDRRADGIDANLGYTYSGRVPWRSSPATVRLKVTLDFGEIRVLEASKAPTVAGLPPVSKDEPLGPVGAPRTPLGVLTQGEDR